MVGEITWSLLGSLVFLIIGGVLAYLYDRRVLRESRGTALVTVFVTSPLTMLVGGVFGHLFWCCPLW